MIQASTAVHVHSHHRTLSHMHSSPDLYDAYQLALIIYAVIIYTYAHTHTQADYADNLCSGHTHTHTQATFPGPKDSVFEFTTQVNIIPNTFYYPDCKGKECQGHLV